MNFISVYMSDKAVSSGDGCDPYSDDEDCYDEGSNNNNKNSNSNYNDDEDDEEGSGSGDFVSSSKPGGNNKSKDASQSGKPHDDSDDEEGDNWPPWVTAKPEGDKDIVVDDPTKQVPSPKVTSGARQHLSKALLYYLIPVLTCLVGSLASW
jgi:hypothetical protein